MNIPVNLLPGARLGPAAYETIPTRIQERIAGKTCSMDQLGKSGAEVLLFEDMVLKIEGQGPDSENEYQMMTWLQSRLPVPRVICREVAGGISYLLMSKIPGKPACDGGFLEDPHKLTALLADSFQMLWSVDTANCPRRNQLEQKLALAEYQVAHHLVNTEDAEPGTYGPGGFRDPEQLLQWLQENRPKETPVLSHGDFCLPNILLESGRVNGFIDLSRSGTADKWQDLALCYRSLNHNMNGDYGGKAYSGFQDKLLFEALNLEPDWAQIRYYILLDELF